MTETQAPALANPLDRTLAAHLLAWIPPPVLAVLAIWGHNAMDSIRPDVPTATIFYTIVAVVAVAVTVIAGLTINIGGLWGATLGVGVPVGFLISQFASSYSDDWIFGAFIVAGLLGTTYLATLITALVVGARDPTRGARAAVTGGLMPTIMLGTAAIYHLLTLERQEQLAIEAHNAPAAAVVVILALLLGLAAWRRSR